VVRKFRFGFRGIAHVDVIAATGHGTGRHEGAADHQGQFGRECHPGVRELRHIRGTVRKELLVHKILHVAVAEYKKKPELGANCKS